MNVRSGPVASEELRREFELARPIPGARLWACDALRLAAMGAVALRHLLSIDGRDPAVIPYALGIPTFCALSGFLALRPGGVGPFAWLWGRLKRIYVPYWLCL